MSSCERGIFIIIIALVYFLLFFLYFFFLDSLKLFIEEKIEHGTNNDDTSEYSNSLERGGKYRLKYIGSDEEFKSEKEISPELISDHIYIDMLLIL